MAKLSSASPLTAPPPRPPLCRRRRRHVSMSFNPNPKTLFAAVSNLLWAHSLPPQPLISAVRSTWHATWHLLMSQLAPSDSSGNYSRPNSRFPRQNPQLSGQKLTALRLYAGLPCPWAHRTLIVRALKGLEESVPLSVASPGIDGAWELPDAKARKGAKTLRAVYETTKGGYSGRATVPMLWDEGEREVVCNESYDIIELFNSGLNELATNPGLDLSPPSLKGEIEKWNRIIYPNVNNGVYRCGFAQSQQAYDSAIHELFSTLDMLDNHLDSSRYLCGDVLTLADVCLFTTLIRFDLVYNILFKCTKRKLIEYPNLHAYIRDIYQIPKVAATCDFEAIMDGYYRILFPLNPGSIRPIMPSKCEHDSLSEPHNRGSFSLVDEVVPLPVA